MDLNSAFLVALLYYPLCLCSADCDICALYMKSSIFTQDMAGWITSLSSELSVKMIPMIAGVHNDTTSPSPVTSRMCNPLNTEWNSICHLLALLEAHPILHIGRIRVKWRHTGCGPCLHQDRPCFTEGEEIPECSNPFGWSWMIL